VTAVCTDRVFGYFLLVMALNGVLVGPYLPFMPVYVEEELGASQATTATMRTLGLVGMAIFVFAGGIVTDTFGPKVSLLLGLMATPVAGLLFVVGGQTTVGGDSIALSPIAALSFVQGGLNGILDGAGMATLVTAAPAGSIGAATALYFVSYTGAQALGNAVAGVFVAQYGFTGMGIAMLAGSFPLLMFAVAVLPSNQVVETGTQVKRATPGEASAPVGDGDIGTDTSSSYWEVIRTYSTQYCANVQGWV
jgi:MFS family permease